MHKEARDGAWRSCLFRLVATALLLTVAACSPLSDTRKPNPGKNAPRAQLSIGYSLLYQEADGIPKLKWILMFKDKPEEMGRITNDLLSYYQQLAETLQGLSKQYPAMRIDVPAMSDIEGEVRKAMGADEAKDFAPLVGKTGVDFEREALLMFYNALDEQRHLTAVMVGIEEILGVDKESVGGTLRESWGAIEPPLFHSLSGGMRSPRGRCSWLATGTNWRRTPVYYV
jgi:hypothetical protein